MPANTLPTFTPAQFDYELPPELIAQTPAEPPESARLLIVNRNTGELQHKTIADLVELLGPNDLLVRNNTKVIPARLYGQKPTGGRVELLMVRPIRHDAQAQTWECLSKPGLKIGQTVAFPSHENPILLGECAEILEYTRAITFTATPENFWALIDQVGQTPTPPYIHWDQADEAYIRAAYQTYYAKINGSVAAPTAGLHFTAALDEKLRARGVQILELTLHVGLGTFLPLQDAQLARHTLHPEFYQISAEVAAEVTAAKAAGKRIIAIGTTTTRALESAARNGQLTAAEGDTTLFIQPGYQFQIVDSMITNFHLPKSSLLMLVSAITSAPNTAQPFGSFAENPIGQAYQAALAEKYRFFSFGDAMWIY